MTSLRNSPLTCGLNSTGDLLTISVGFNTLLHAIMMGPEWPEELVITKKDQKAFLKSFLRGLETEEEDGTNPIHRMLDAVALECLEQGDEGFTEYDDDEGAHLEKELVRLRKEMGTGPIDFETIGMAANTLLEEIPFVAVEDDKPYEYHRQKVDGVSAGIEPSHNVKSTRRVVTDAVANARKDAEGQLGTLDRALKMRVERRMQEESSNIPDPLPDDFDPATHPGLTAAERLSFAHLIVPVTNEEVLARGSGEDESQSFECECEPYTDEEVAAMNDEFQSIETIPFNDLYNACVTIECAHEQEDRTKAYGILAAYGITEEEAFNEVERRRALYAKADDEVRLAMRHAGMMP